MTTLRPERGAEDRSPMSYEDTGAFRAVVESMDDPLSDPLPGRAPAAPPESAHEPPPERGQGRHAATRGPAPGAAYGPAPDTPGASPWLDMSDGRQQRPGGVVEVPPVESLDATMPMAALQALEADGAPYRAAPDAHTGYDAYTAPGAYAAPAAPGHPGAAAAPGPAAAPDDPAAPATPPAYDVPAAYPAPAGPGAHSSPADPAPAAAYPAPDGPAVYPAPGGPAAAPEDGGRAARRKAARQSSGGHRARAGRPPAGGPANAEQPDAPRSRVEARRAARAAKDSPAVVLSRAVGELFITLGVVMLLFVTYQLWWTNVRAHQQASRASNNLEQQWSATGQNPDRNPGAFSPGQGFAIMYIPKLDVKAPIAQGVSKPKVLDHGMIGHYDGEPVNTAMPWDTSGNFALAAHRNTHGEPFRYINHLVPGDKIVVETATTYYTYVVTSTLPSTPPSNIDVLKPVPPGSGFTRPGRYITLTTCTPEFTSTNRLIVWGKLAQQQPRSQGKPDALVNG